MNENKYKERTASRKIILKNEDGTPCAGQSVHVELVNPEFLFGCGGFDFLQFETVREEEKTFFKERMDRFLELFNYATLPFYWGTFESEEGKPETERLKKAAANLVNHGVKVKGHPLCWHTVCAPWLLKYSDEEILKKQLERIDREVKGFKGLVDIWDVINETCIMPVFDKYDNAVTRICNYKGRNELCSLVFNRAVSNNPQGTFLINDFNTTDDYAHVIEELLEKGVQISAIGIQSHQHQGYWGIEKTQRVLERFEKFGLPIHFTENTILSGRKVPPEIQDLNDYQVKEWPSTPEGEKEQADQLVEMYRVLFSHPLVKAITGWDLCDGQWLGAPSGILHKDNSPKPAFYALKDLIRHELSTSYDAVTDKDGALNLEGYRGEYLVKYSGKSIKATL